MNLIRICKQVESETLFLPELRPLIGQTVEITVQEKPARGAAPGNWPALERLARQLQGYDFDAWQEQREFDILRARAQQP